MGFRAADQFVRFGLVRSEAFRQQSRLHHQRQRQHDNAQSPIPLHPGAAEKKRGRRTVQRGQRAQTGRRHSRDRFKKGIQKTQPKAHHRIGHHERREEKHQRHQHHPFIRLHTGRRPQPCQAHSQDREPANHHAIAQADARVAKDHRHHQRHQRQRGEHEAQLTEILQNHPKADCISELGRLFTHK